MEEKREKMELDDTTEDGTGKLVRLFKRTLYVALFQQQKAFKGEILKLRKEVAKLWYAVYRGAAMMMITHPVPKGE